MTLRETALELLKKYDCSLDTYRDDRLGWALKDVQAVCPEGLHGFTAPQIAMELQNIGNDQPYNSPLPHGIVKATDICGDRMYAGRWGIADMHEDVKQNLQKLLDSGERFDTGWLCSAKCEDNARVSFDGFNIYVEAGISVPSMEDFDYIYDCLDNDADWELLDDDDLNDLYDTLLDNGYEENVDAVPKFLPKRSTVDDILTSISDLVCQAEAVSESVFGDCRKIVNDYVKWVKEGRK